jgi:tetratricopeptide (TPR) repeat protein
MQTLATYLPGPDAFVFPVDAGDLTQDGVPDLVFADVSCRDDTCWHAPHVWSWSNGDFRDVMAGAPRLPYAEFSLDEGRLLARSPGLSSLEAGPQRVITQTWSWSGEVLALTAEEVGPPRYRYHALREGDEALFVGEYAEAFAAYLRVLNDPALDPWAGAYGAQEETRWLRALAHWRLMTLGYELGNFPDAEEHYAALQEWDPEEAGWPVADLARRFHEEYLATGSVMRACRASVDAPEAEFVLRFLNSFGYANPTYNAEGLCPFLGP